MLSTYSISFWRTDKLERISNFAYVTPSPKGFRLLQKPEAGTKSGIAALRRLHSDDRHSNSFREIKSGLWQIALMQENENEPPSGLYVIDLAAESLQPAGFGLSLWNKAVKRLPSSPLEDGIPFRMPQFDEAAERFASDAVTTRISLSAETPEAFAAALDELSSRIEHKGLDEIVLYNKINLVFDIAGREMSEREFFTRISQHELVQLVPSLRRLLTQYLAGFPGGEGSQPWSGGEDPDNRPALSHCLHALALLDLASTDIMRTYFSKRDGEHESWCWPELVPAWAGHHGLSSDEHMRFGIFAVLNCI